MSMIDPDGPMICKQEVEQYFPDRIAYISILETKNDSTKIIIKKIHIDEIAFAYSSSGTLLEEWVEFHYFIEKRVFPFLKKQLVKIKPKHQYYSSDFYSIYMPEKLIPMKYLFKSEDLAMKNALNLISKNESIRDFSHLFV